MEMVMYNPRQHLRYLALKYPVSLNALTDMWVEQGKPSMIKFELHLRTQKGRWDLYIECAKESSWIYLLYLNIQRKLYRSMTKCKTLWEKERYLLSKLHRKCL